MFNYDFRIKETIVCHVAVRCVILVLDFFLCVCVQKLANFSMICVFRREWNVRLQEQQLASWIRFLTFFFFFLYLLH